MITTLLFAVGVTGAVFTGLVYDRAGHAKPIPTDIDVLCAASWGLIAYTLAQALNTLVQLR